MSDLPSLALEASNYGVKPPFKNQAKEKNEAKAAIWRRLFGTPYDAHWEGLSDRMAKAIKSALRDFESQYASWKKRIKKAAQPCVRQSLADALGSIHGESMEAIEKGCIELAIVNDPFTPTLSFRGVDPALDRALNAYALN